MKLKEAIHILKIRQIMLEKAVEQPVKVAYTNKISFGWVICFSLLDGEGIYGGNGFIVDKKYKTYYIMGSAESIEDNIAFFEKQREYKTLVYLRKFLNKMDDYFMRY